MMLSKDKIITLTRRVFFSILSLSCAAFLVLALVYIQQLLIDAPNSLKAVVWAITGTGLFILSTTLLYLKGRRDAQTAMMERIHELKDHIVELQRFNQEMEKKMNEWGRSDVSSEKHSEVSIYSPSIESTRSKSSSASEGREESQKKMKHGPWFAPWKNPKT